MEIARANDRHASRRSVGIRDRTRDREIITGIVPDRARCNLFVSMRTAMTRLFTAAALLVLKKKVQSLEEDEHVDTDEEHEP